ncbi:MAG: hypothetical protein LBM59_05315 [Ruminococcus sp.]|jgi:hypothetical protein|nr:hypothetical protein [Ruminococcus sp.]
MSGFLAAKERCEEMNRRLKNYHQSSLNVNHPSVKSKTAFIPEAVFERVDKTESKKPAQKSAPKQINNTLFGIELTRDNCLIIALILMLMKEKAELPLIAALIFLLI